MTGSLKRIVTSIKLCQDNHQVFVLARQHKNLQLIGLTHKIAISWNSLSNKDQDWSISCILSVLCHKMLVFPFLPIEQRVTFLSVQNHDAVSEVSLLQVAVLRHWRSHRTQHGGA